MVEKFRLPVKKLHPKRCELCAYFEPPEQPNGSGQCVANYPVVVPFPTGAAQMGAASIFPPMKPEQRCGKWEEPRMTVSFVTDPPPIDPIV